MTFLQCVLPFLVHFAKKWRKQKQLLKRVPSNKCGHIKNIYNAIEFIINSDYVNNSEIKIDGGL